MTRAETGKLMALIAIEHEKFLDTPDPTKRLDLWSEVFERVPYEIVEFAVKRTLAESPYAPKLSDVVERVKELVRRDDDNAVDAWNLLAKMAAQSTRVTQGEFDALPYEVKGFCGNLAGLKSLGNNEEDIFNTVTRGQFMKVYDNLRQRREWRESMPPEILAIIQSLVPELPSPNVSKKREVTELAMPVSPPPPELEHIFSGKQQSAQKRDSYTALTDEEWNNRRNEYINKLEQLGGESTYDDK